MQKFFLFSPSPFFVVDECGDKSDGNAEPDGPPDADTSKPCAEPISQRDAEDPKTKEAGNHREERGTCSAQGPVQYV